MSQKSSRGRGSHENTAAPAVPVATSRSVSVEPQSELSAFRVAVYGVGHVYNDLCSAMWFTYLLIFFTHVLKFGATEAGMILLIGQVTDGIATPLVGLESDRVGLRFIQRYGQRKSWHAFGTIFVTLSFPFLFMRCPGCSASTSQLSMMVFYIPCVITFQIGWAAVQISHLAMIPELARTSHDRMKLNSVRYAFTVIANLLVFGMCAAILGTDQVKQTKVTPHDAHSFKLLGLLIVGIGLIFSIAFHVGVREGQAWRSVETSTPDRALYSVLSTDSGERRLGAKTWRHWLRELRFYQIAVIYTCARLLVNVTQTYLPFWLLETEHFKKARIHSAGAVDSLPKQFCHFVGYEPQNPGAFRGSEEDERMQVMFHDDVNMALRVGGSMACLNGQPVSGKHKYASRDV